MRIAVIGWGSLIWSPGSLSISTRWHRDGPLLPVEFARISGDGRLTLVIHPGSADQSTLWAIAASEDIAGAREDLRRRERTNSAPIHSLIVDGYVSRGVTGDVQNAIAAWLSTRPQTHGCVWTGLPSNWQGARRCEFSIEDAIRYLQELPDPQRAQEYIQNAPAQIQTEARKQIRVRLGWQDADLPDMLFENV
jgi:hypothetical protein